MEILHKFKELGLLLMRPTTPAMSIYHDAVINKFWEDTSISVSGPENELEAEFNVSTIKILTADDLGCTELLPTEDSLDELHLSDTENTELLWLPTGKTERRLVKDYFKKLHDGTRRLQEMFYNLILT